MIRAFIAVNLTVRVVEAITRVQEILKQAGGDVRWVRPEGFHLTLKFLGDIPNHKPPLVLAALQEALRGHPPLLVRAQGLGAFPTLKRPRVLWVGLGGEGLEELRERVEQAMIPLDFPPEDRQFTPHLTLGRVRSLRGWEKVLAALKERQAEGFGESRIEEVVLYKSDLRPEGALYTPLGKVTLGGHG